MTEPSPVRPQPSRPHSSSHLSSLLALTIVGCATFTPLGLPPDVPDVGSSKIPVIVSAPARIEVNERRWYTPVTELARTTPGYQFNLRTIVQGIFGREIEAALEPKRRRGDVEVRVHLAGAQLDLSGSTAEFDLKLGAEYWIAGHADDFRRQQFEEHATSSFNGEDVPDAVVECVQRAARQFAATLPRLPGTESGAPEKSERVALPPFTEQRHAVLVGISQYRDNNFSRLPNARGDATAIAQFLRSPEGGNIAADRVQVLTDKQATRANIIQALVRAGRESQPGDLILVYLGCHAVAPAGQESERFFVPFDGRMDQPEATGIPKSEIERELDEAEAHRQLMLLDCCFAGPVTRGRVEDDAFANLEGRHRVIVTSTKGSERALDGLRAGDHSPFATSVLRALRGQIPGVDGDEDGRLSAKEVYEAVRLEVIRSAEQLGSRMTPQLFGDAQFASELEIVRLPDLPDR